MGRTSTTSKGSVVNKSNNKGGKKSTVKSAQTYQEEEEDEEEEEEVEEDGIDATQDDDPVSTHELAQVLKAFTRGKNKKAADGSKLIEKQIQDLIDSTHTKLDSWIKSETDKCDTAVENLNLEDESVPGGIDAISYAKIIHELSNESGSILDTLDNLVRAFNPENNEYYTTSQELLLKRSIQAKKSHKKLVKSLRKQREEQLDMAQMHAETGPIIYKHLKAIVRA